jgi:transcriptional regulator with XRE-family HTH domain
MLVTELGPVVQRTILTNELLRLRQAHGSTQDQVASALDWSPSKLIRIEGGAVGISKTDLEALLRYYGIAEDNPIIEELTLLAKGARQHGWWALYKNDIGKAYQEFIGYESGSAIVRCFQALTIPGLLQTEEYANAVTREFLPDRSACELVVEVRIQRQERLFARQDPPQLAVVIDEAALRRKVGGQADPEIMLRQLHHLIDILREPYFSLEIVPFGRGAYLGMMGVGFTILSFSDARMHDVVFLESGGGERRPGVRQRPAHFHYRAVFENLQQMALPTHETAQFIREIIDSMT